MLSQLQVGFNIQGAAVKQYDLNKSLNIWIINKIYIFKTKNVFQK